MLILITSPDHDIYTFISQIRESSCDFSIISLQEWQENNTKTLPEGFIYIRTAPENSFKKIDLNKKPLSLDQIKAIYEEYEQYFVKKTSMPDKLKTIPTLILNGNINIADDFSQFYTHLFSIKKFFQQIKTDEEKRKGIYSPPKKKHHNCKC